MADHFTKLWASILDSSVWREPPGHRLVWIAMLLMKDRNGFVGASIDGLARRANVSEEETRAAIESFLAPDPRSRNQDNEGRRIVVVPRGWHILNHEYFTQLQDKEAMRAYEAARKADQRRRAKLSQNVPDTAGQERDSGDKPELHIHVQPTSTGQVPEGEPEREGDAAKAPERPQDVPEDLWQEWRAFRRRKNAPVTKRVLDATRRTATAAGMTMAEAFDYWIANGQTGFFPPKGGANAKPQDGGYDRFGNWKGVPKGKVDYSVGLGEDDPEHPKQLLANENGIRASKGLPPLTMDELRKMGDPRLR